jgi:hypothetical protein
VQLCYALFELSRLLKRRRHLASTKIQCRARIRQARRLAAWRRLHRRALQLVHCRVSRWWRQRQRVKLEAAATLLLQRCRRGGEGRARARLARGRRAELLRREAAQRRREQSEMAGADVSAPECPGTVEVRTAAVTVTTTAAATTATTIVTTATATATTTNILLMK